MTQDEGKTPQFQGDREGVGALPLKSVECGNFRGHYICILTCTLARAQDRPAAVRLIDRDRADPQPRALRSARAGPTTGGQQ